MRQAWSRYGEVGVGGCGLVETGGLLIRTCWVRLLGVETGLDFGHEACDASCVSPVTRLVSLLAGNECVDMLVSSLGSDLGGAPRDDVIAFLLRQATLCRNKNSNPFYLSLLRLIKRVSTNSVLTQYDPSVLTWNWLSTR